MEVFCENPGIFLGTLGPKNEDREFINVWLIGLDSCRPSSACVCRSCYAVKHCHMLWTLTIVYFMHVSIAGLRK